MRSPFQTLTEHNCRRATVLDSARKITASTRKRFVASIGPRRCRSAASAKQRPVNMLSVWILALVCGAHAVAMPRIENISFLEPLPSENVTRTDQSALAEDLHLDTASLEPGRQSVTAQRLYNSSAPLGFDRHRWGVPLAQIAGTDLTEIAFMRQASDADGLQFFKERCSWAVHDAVYSCLQPGPAEARAPDRATQHAIVLAEYRKPEVVYFLRDTGALFSEASYDVCAINLGGSSYPPKASHIKELLQNFQFCGVRLKFTHIALLQETGELIDDNEARVLRALKQAFGDPIPPPTPSHRGAEGLDHQTWCAQEFQLDCLAEVVYAYDKGSGNGFVNFATPALYAYVHDRFARLNAGSPPEFVDYYFMLLLRNPPARLSRRPAILADQYEPHDIITAEIEAKFNLNAAPIAIARRAQKGVQRSAGGGKGSPEGSAGTTKPGPIP